MRIQILILGFKGLSPKSGKQPEVGGTPSGIVELWTNMAAF